MPSKDRRASPGPDATLPIRSGIRVPIFASLLTANVGLVGLSVASLVALSVREFRADKESYVFDFAAQVAEGIAEQVGGGLEAEREKLALLATVVLDRSRTKKAQAHLVQSMFVHYPEVVRFEVIPQRGPPVRLHNVALLRQLGFESSGAYDEAFPGGLPELPSDDGGVLVSPRHFHADAVGLTVAFRHRIPGGSPVTVSGDVFARSLTEPFAEAGVAEMFLVDPNGRVVLHHDLERVTAGIDLSGSDIVQQARRTKLPGSMSFEEDGRAYLGAYAPVTDGFTVVSRVPEDIAYAAGDRLVRKSLLAGAALLGLMSIAAGLVARRFSAPLVRMSKATGQIAGGDFKVSVAVDRRNEIGDLARSINHMSGELLARDKRLEEQKEALVASEKMAALGTLGAGIAHEVKNPLTGIQGFAELAMRKVKPDDPIMRYLQMIDKETRRCTEIIGNLLKFSRREKVEYKPTDLNQVVADTYKLVNHQLNLKKVSVDLTLTPEIPSVMANGNQLQQVLLNLAINAGDAMPNGGKFKFITELGSGGNGKPNVVIKATDNGSGIPPDVKARIFDPFFTTKEPGKGTGLGLSVTFGIIKDHGGTVTVESEIGKGTTFIISLPVEAGAGATAPGMAANGSHAVAQRGNA